MHMHMHMHMQLYLHLHLNPHMDLHLYLHLITLLQVYGPWPGPSWIMKMRFAPTWKSLLDDSNWHTVTMLVARGLNPQNHLHLGPLLSRVFALF